MEDKVGAIDNWMAIDIIMTIVEWVNRQRAYGFVVEVKCYGGPATPCALSATLKGRKGCIFGIVLTSLAIKEVEGRNVLFLGILALAVKQNGDGPELRGG
jgi:hypothetical protein